MDQLRETVAGIGDKRDPANLDVKVKVGWVKGQNHLYFLYEASDNYWDFAREDLHNDIFEVVIDGDLSGGPLIRQMHPIEKLRDQARHALSLPRRARAELSHLHSRRRQGLGDGLGLQPGSRNCPTPTRPTSTTSSTAQSGKLVLEFFVTPFDYAPPDPARAVPSKLEEDKVIGMSWAILDYDDEKAERYAAFWNLSHKTTMYGDASDLVAFRLMPIEKSLRKPVEADWSFQVIDREDRVVAFRDRSYGNITSWRWDFGDGKPRPSATPLTATKRPASSS